MKVLFNILITALSIIIGLGVCSGCGGGGGGSTDPPPAVSIIGTWLMWATAAPTDTFEWRFALDGSTISLYNLDSDDPDSPVASVTVSGNTFVIAGQAWDGEVMLKFEGSGSFSAGAISGTMTTTQLIDGVIQDVSTEAIAGERSS